MSRYSDKVAARRSSVGAAIDLAIRITEGEVPAPKASAAFKPRPFRPAKVETPSNGPHPTKPRRSFDLADLGDAPAKCADALERAAKLVFFAQGEAEKMIMSSASAWQTQEPQSIAQFCLSIRVKLDAMSKRALVIPTARSNDNGND